MGIPKKYEKVMLHFIDCFWNNERCMHCHDGLAFAINIRLLKYKEYQDSVYDPDYLLPDMQFYKFIVSYGKRYLPCIRAIDLEDFSKWLMSCNPEKLRYVKSYLKCHTELKGELGDTVLLRNPI
jgi:hypothetical protein